MKERIYCSELEEGKEMAGILIYTASGDSEGTLGGLVRQGRSDLLPHIFQKAMESARTCSNDPVCGLSLGQGRDSLNLAACYSCTLIPETSCEVFNIFLDRGTVVGTFENRKMGFYSDFVYGNREWNSDQIRENTKEGSNPKEEKVVLLVKTGTDVSEMAYSEIWQQVKTWLDNDEEKEIIDEIIAFVDKLEGKEKPESEGDFSVAGESEIFNCDLLWRKSKVMFFTSSNKDDYKVAQNSEWKCFYSMDLHDP